MFTLSILLILHARFDVRLTLSIIFIADTYSSTQMIRGFGSVLVHNCTWRATAGWLGVTWCYRKINIDLLTSAGNLIIFGLCNRRFPSYNTLVCLKTELKSEIWSVYVMVDYCSLSLRKRKCWNVHVTSMFAFEGTRHTVWDKTWSVLVQNGVFVFSAFKLISEKDLRENVQYLEFCKQVEWLWTWETGPNNAIVPFYLVFVLLCCLLVQSEYFQANSRGIKHKTNCIWVTSLMPSLKLGKSVNKCFIDYD